MEPLDSKLTFPILLTVYDATLTQHFVRGWETELPPDEWAGGELSFLFGLACKKIADLTARVEELENSLLT